MNELFLVTENGNIAIKQELVEKYGLKKGARSPFTNQLIVDKDGDATIEIKTDNPVSLKQLNQESQMFSTAEIIDIAQGADS